jgi:hypothetical protein
MCFAESQKTSWGPIQIMGGVARELGYEGYLVRVAGVSACSTASSTKFLSAPRASRSMLLRQYAMAFDAFPIQPADGRSAIAATVNTNKWRSGTRYSKAIAIGVKINTFQHLHLWP